MDVSETTPVEPEGRGPTEEAAVATAADQCPVDHSAAESAAPGAGSTSTAAESKSAEAGSKSTEAVAAEPATIPATAIAGPRIPSMIQVLWYWKRPAAFMKWCHKRYGGRFALSRGIPPRPLYVITDPEDIKRLFLAPADVLHTGRGSAMIEKFTGTTGLAWLDEEEHKVRRKLLMPTMHGKALQRIDAAIEEITEREVATWPHGQTVEVHPYIHRLTLNVIREVIFGRATPKCWDELLDVLTRMMRFNNGIASTMMIHRMSPMTVRLLKAIPTLGLKEFLKLRTRADELIAEAVAERRASGELGDDMLSVLLGITHDDGSPLDATELRDEMMTIFLAGTETTVVALTWAFIYLSRDREALERLVAEIDAGESDTYITAVVHEVLRLRPSIPQIITREVMKPIEIGGVRYEPGTLIWASGFLLHRNPTLYPEPEEFRPERFVGVKPGTHTWIPFGGGRIRCLGAEIATIEMKAVLREVLSQYELAPVNSPLEGVRSRIVVMRPAKGGRVQFRPRTREKALA